MVEDLSIPDISYITYSVPNLEKDVSVTFVYNGNCSPFTIDENPFKVCHNTDCKENIETYDFKKGESYKIMVKLQKKKIQKIQKILLFIMFCQVIHFMI